MATVLISDDLSPRAAEIFREAEEAGFSEAQVVPDRENAFLGDDVAIAREARAISRSHVARQRPEWVARPED